MSLPSLEDLFYRIPLYQEIKLDISNARELEGLEGSIDCYCSECKKERIFNSKIDMSAQLFWLHSVLAQSDDKQKIILIELTCTKIEKHKMYIQLYLTSNILVKIGQFPSMATLGKNDTVEYKNILGKESYDEFNRGIGLISHGVGIGAFVYLRRIFEKLISETHKEAKEEDNWNEELYRTAKMDQKIELLKGYLPDVLIENKQLYSVLSKGIHQLSEKECLEYFPIVRTIIELILDEKMEQHKKKIKKEAAKQALAGLHKTVSHK
jgi:hypothetical protein